MRRWLILILIPFISLFLEATFFGSFALLGAVPDLVLIFVTFYAIINGANQSFTYGFLCGLFEDLILGRFIGTNAVAKGLTALVIGKLQVNVFRENIVVGVGGVLLATVLNTIFFVLIAIIADMPFIIDKYFFITLGAQLLYNALLSIPLYVWYYRASKFGLLKPPSPRR